MLVIKFLKSYDTGLKCLIIELRKWFISAIFSSLFIKKLLKNQSTQKFDEILYILKINYQNVDKFAVIHAKITIFGVIFA